MKPTLDGYRFERELRSSAAAQVFLATRLRDQKSVIAKVFSIEERPSLELRVAHELELIQALDVPGVVRALACERSGPHLFLLLEAYPGVDLATYARGEPLPLDRFFTIACRLTATLGRVHEQRVIHRDIKPTNVLVSEDGSDVMLADFGISVLLESERGFIHDPSILTGTLPYVSPEQTGRTGREVDFRSDLYSLGVTFYELLTGQRPFVADTPLELIHAHLARRPESPRRLRPELPQALARLVMKLLEKAPERRYQSARGLLDDLERIRDALADGTLGAFEIATSDVPLSLQFPHRLYGREGARAQLHVATRQTIDAPPTLVFVLGEPGVGKSALVDELAGHAVALGGRLIRGGFERGRDEPLFGLSLALASLADQLLTEAPDELARWQRQLRAELGPLGAVLVELAPRFAALVEDRTPVAGEAGDAARNRVRQACVRVLELAADPRAPLLLVLDDMQWADAETLAVIDALAASSRAGLAVVLVARPEAMLDGHPLASLRNRLAARSHARPPITIELGPLSRDDLVELLHDTLSRTDEPLAELILRKTGGNPFFVRQFLTYLYERELLRRDRSGWVWELDELARAGLPSDAIEMLAGRLASLDPSMRELVGAAAVLGSEIELDLLAGMLGRDGVSGGVAAELLALVDQGVLGPGPSGELAFVHGRLREVALASLEPGQRRRWHRLAGEQLLARLSPEALEHNLFDVVEQLDRGYGLWPGEVGDEPLDEPRIEQLIALNLRAGRRALASGVPIAARTFLDIAAGLLRECPRGPGERMRSVHVQVTRELAAAESLTHAGEAADRRLLELLDSPLDPLERAEVALIRARTLMTAARLETAVDVALDALAVLGVEVPRRPGTITAARLLPRILKMLRPEGLARVRVLEPMQDRRIELALALLLEVGPGAFMVSPELFLVFAVTEAELILAHGRHPAMPVVFGQLGLVLANALGRRRQALELSRFCAELAAGGPYAYRLENNMTFLGAWLEPLPALVPKCERAAAMALVQGDINAASIARSNEISYALYGGLHLRAVEERVEARWRWVEQWSVQTSAPGGPEVARACRRLREGPEPQPGEIDVLGLFERQDAAPRVECDFAMLDALVAVVFDRWATVYALLDPRVDRIQQVVPGSWYVGPSRLWWGIACAELARDATGSQLRALRRKLGAAATVLADWRAEGGNFGHFVDLLEAELAVLDGDLPRASRLYERAREQAMAQQHAMLAGLASERHARAWARAGQRRLALGPLLDAHERYAVWGAFAKRDALEREWPELAHVLAAHSTPVGTSEDEAARDGTQQTEDRSTSSTANRALDVASLMQAAQTLAADLRVNEVLSRVMAIALENAGAVRGVLLLISKGEISLAAEADLDHTAAFLDEPPPLAEIADRVPASLLHYVQRTAEPVVLDAVEQDPRFASDPYFRALAAEGAGISVLCLPMVKRGRPVGLLYFENQLGAAAFGPARVELLQLLAGHAASALENARLYENLRDSEIRWRSLVDQLPDYVILVGRNGRLEYVNAVARPRQPSNAFAFNAPREFVSGPDAGLVTAAVAQALASGAREQLEVRVGLSGSDERWYALRVAPVAIEGAIDRAIVVATDIDDRKRAEAERDQLEARLRQQQRLDSVGTLASGVAHEINNPIQGIMNYAELIAGSSAADEMIREFADEIAVETQRVATIVRQLLAFSRQELTEAVEATAISELIEGTVSLIRAVMRRDQIKLDIELPADLPRVECRRQQIHQVIMNLVTNARDALNSRWRGYHELKQIRIGAEAFERDGAAWVRINVSDKAGGVPLDIVARIFDPFFTTKGRDHGTGLGLAVSHGIVSEHGGLLTLDNHPGEGATFMIELPCLSSTRPQT